MWKKVAFGVAGMLAVLVIVVVLRSPNFRVERSMRMAAPPRAVYDRIADFHRWAEWSPWAHVDPNMKQAFLGATSGAGAEYTWSGNSRIGQGRMAIFDARPGERIAMSIDFTRPLASTSRTEFRLVPDGDGVRVVWTMDGTYGFAAKAVSLLASMDAMLGRDFENGLAKLKAVTEAEAAAAAVR